MPLEPEQRRALLERLLGGFGGFLRSGLSVRHCRRRIGEDFFGFIDL